MLGVTSGSELFWNSEGSNFKKKKWHVNLDSITFQRNYKNRIKISIEKSTLDLPWNYLKFSEHQLFIIKKLITRM